MLQIRNMEVEPFGPEQSFYLTCADVQTIPQASVYYLIELTSLGSLNSLYFIPSSVVANNGRYTKMNFYVWPGYQSPDPTLGQITFNTTGVPHNWTKYPMGFYTYKIYEQTSSTNLDTTLATSQLEEGMAIVRNYNGLNKEVDPYYIEYPRTGPSPIESFTQP
tara:strand:+ start:92 stop:580 length:489 start_codon:yes stop_codon:yes gene_type:complete